MWRKIRENAKIAINHVLEKISVVVNILCALAIILVCVLTILFFIAYMQLSFGYTELPLCFRILSFVGFLSPDISISPEHTNTLKGVLEYCLNFTVAVSGIILSCFTVFSYFRKVVAIKHTSCFNKVTVVETGKEDINIMLRYFKGADFVRIYSHTFGWAAEGDMNTILTTLAETNKLQLYSSAVDVAQGKLEGSPHLKKCLNKTDIPLHFSYVERDNARYLLYRQEEHGHTYIFVVHENTESKYLLQTISQLVTNH